MSERDCKHGNLARVCLLCECEERIEELERENAELRAERDRCPTYRKRKDQQK